MPLLLLLLTYDEFHEMVLITRSRLFLCVESNRLIYWWALWCARPLLCFWLKFLIVFTEQVNQRLVVRLIILSFSRESSNFDLRLKLGWTNLFRRCDVRKNQKLFFSLLNLKGRLIKVMSNIAWHVTQLNFISFMATDSIFSHSHLDWLHKQIHFQRDDTFG